MRKISQLLLGAGVALGLLSGATAHASTDLPGLYDARAVAIGGTGVSYVENGASVFLNPATLDGIKTFAGSLTLSPIRPTLSAPIHGPGQPSVTSAGNIYPLFLIGAGYRLSDRVTVGLAVYPTAGFGADYDDSVPGDLNLTLAQYEASPAVSIKIVDGLSIGLGYRITYTKLDASLQGAPPQPASKLKLDGTNFFGVHAGIYYRPNDALHFGVTYRSRVTTSIDGTTEVAGTKLDTKSKYGSPDRIRAGASYSLLDKKLLLALDLKYLLFSVSNKSLDTTTTTPAGPVENSIKLDWKNVFGFGVGAEYWVVPTVAVRGGYSLSQSATPKSTASIFTPPPALLHGIHLGAGITLSNLDLDLAGLYTFGNAHVGANPNNPAVIPGDYGLQTTIVSLSATYHM